MTLRADNEDTRSTQELLAVQGQAMDIGGYYAPDLGLGAEAMRPSTTFNEIIDAI